MARYIAVHDYTASSEEDISFSRGEVIIVTDKSNPDWWSGRVGEEEDGPIGRFPSNVVETEEDYEHDIEDAHETRLIAIHGFQGDDEDDLSFEEGDVIIGTVLHQGWWTGHLEGQDEVGSFPANYVTEIENPAESVGDESIHEHVRLRAEHTFESEDDTDLNFLEGDILIGYQLNQGWWEGEHTTNVDDATGQPLKGMFPDNYVEYLGTVAEYEENQREDEEKQRRQEAEEKQRRQEAEEKQRLDQQRAIAAARKKREEEERREKRKSEELKIIEQRKKEAEAKAREKEFERQRLEQIRKEKRRLAKEAREEEMEAQRIREAAEMKRRKEEKAKRAAEAAKQYKMKLAIEMQREKEKREEEKARVLKEAKDAARKNKERKLNLIRRDKERAMSKERRRLIDTKKKEYVKKAYETEGAKIAKEKKEAQRELDKARAELLKMETAVKMQSFGGGKSSKTKATTDTTSGSSQQDKFTKLKQLKMAEAAAQKKLKELRKNEADRMLRAREAAEAKAFDELQDKAALDAEKERQQNAEAKKLSNKSEADRKSQLRTKRVQEARAREKKRRREAKMRERAQLVAGRKKYKTEMDISDAAKVAFDPRQYASKVFRSEKTIEKLGVKPEVRTYNSRFGQYEKADQMGPLTPGILNNDSARRLRVESLQAEIQRLEEIATSPGETKSFRTKSISTGSYGGSVASFASYSPPKPTRKKSPRGAGISINQRRRQLMFQMSRSGGHTTHLKLLPTAMRNF
eukprot:g3733.t1